MECPINAKELHYTYLGQEKEYLSLYQISPTEVSCTVQCISKSNFKTLIFSSLKYSSAVPLYILPGIC